MSLNRLFADQIPYIVQVAFWVFLFVVSVAICGYLVFYEPMDKLLRKHFRAASVMMMSTLGWLLIFMIIFLAGLALTLLPV